MPFVSTVFGSSPEPHRMKEPKSLYQSPSGAAGPVPTEYCNLRRSSSEMCRSSTRLRMCSHTGRGRLANRIFGNCIPSEDGPDQLLPGLVLRLGIGLGKEASIARVQVLSGRRLGLYAALRKHHERPAHREMLF